MITILKAIGMQLGKHCYEAFDNCNWHNLAKKVSFIGSSINGSPPLVNYACERKPGWLSFFIFLESKQQCSNQYNDRMQYVYFFQYSLLPFVDKEGLLRMYKTVPRSRIKFSFYPCTS